MSAYKKIILASMILVTAMVAHADNKIDQLNLIIDEGNLTKVQEFLKQARVDINAQDQYGATPLSVAMFRVGTVGIGKAGDYMAIIDELLKHGAQVTADEWVRTAGLKSLELVKKLQGPDINVKDGLGRTILIYAVDRNDLDIIKYILSQKADVNVQDRTDRTALAIAITNFYTSRGTKKNSR